MTKKLFTLLGASVLALQVSALLSQAAPAQEKMDKTKQDRWEGVVIKSNPDKSTLTIRKRGSGDEKTVQYDSSTRWVSQYHGSSKVNDIDASKVQNYDRVICQGTWGNDGVLHATLISKRLSH